jgi:hypothetical protein
VTGLASRLYARLVETFEFAFAERYRSMLRLIGVTPNTALVTVSDEELRVRFGRWRLSTSIDNVEGLERSGDYRWFKAIGARGSFADKGVTFGTNTDVGVCVRFHDPVSALLPGDVMAHPGMTVTVADPDGFAAAVESRLS